MFDASITRARTSAEEMINRVGAMGQLFRVEEHIAKKRALYREAHDPVDGGIWDFYAHREDFIRQILEGLSMVDVDSALFQEVLIDMTPDESGYDRNAYLERFRFYRNFPEGLKILQLVQAVRNLHLYQAYEESIHREKDARADKRAQAESNVWNAKRWMLRLLLELDFHAPACEPLIHDIVAGDKLDACLDTLRAYQEKVKLALAG